MFVNPFERGAIGPELFRVACQMGLEGLVAMPSSISREVLRMLVTGGPRMRGWDSMPLRISTSSPASPALRITGAGRIENSPAIAGRSPTYSFVSNVTYFSY
jgi:hypothetical protein